MSEQEQEYEQTLRVVAHLLVDISAHVVKAGTLKPDRRDVLVSVLMHLESAAGAIAAEREEGGR